VASPTASNSGWKITGQVPTTEVINEKPVKGMRVVFSTGRGVAGEVFIPWAEYGPERARELVSAAVSKIDAVHSLSG